MKHIYYKRCTTGNNFFTNHMRITEEIHDSIVKIHGSIKSWLETILGGNIEVTIESEG